MCAACVVSLGYYTWMPKPNFLSLGRKEWSVMKHVPFEPTIGEIASSWIVNRRSATSSKSDLKLAEIKHRREEIIYRHDNTDTFSDHFVELV
jgi:hypothetical protein